MASTPVFLPGESHVQKNLVGYSPQGQKASGAPEQQSTRALRASSAVLLSPLHIQLWTQFSSLVQELSAIPTSRGL